MSKKHKSDKYCSNEVEKRKKKKKKKRTTKDKKNKSKKGIFIDDGVVEKWKMLGLDFDSSPEDSNKQQASSKMFVHLASTETPPPSPSPEFPGFSPVKKKVFNLHLIFKFIKCTNTM